MPPEHKYFIYQDNKIAVEISQGLKINKINIWIGSISPPNSWGNGGPLQDWILPISSWMTMWGGPFGPQTGSWCRVCLWSGCSRQMCSMPHSAKDLWKWHHFLQLRHPTFAGQGSINVRGQCGMRWWESLLCSWPEWSARVVRGPVWQDASTCRAGMSGRMLVFWGAWDHLCFYVFVSKCVCVCQYFCISVCFTERERQQLQKPGGPRALQDVSPSWTPPGEVRMCWQLPEADERAKVAQARVSGSYGRLWRWHSASLQVWL